MSMSILDSMTFIICVAAVIYMALTGGAILLSDHKDAEVVKKAEFVFLISVASVVVCMLAVLVIGIIKAAIFIFNAF